MFPSSGQLVVPLSKGRISLVLLGSVGFVVLGFWLWSYAGLHPQRDSWYVKTAAVSAIGFFGICGLYALFKFFDTAPGLVIDAQGIFDNSSALCAGLIPWSDIRGLRATTIERRTFLIVDVEDPGKYVRRASFLKRQLVRINAKYFGGPILISTVVLRMDFDELLKVANLSFEKYRRS